MESLSHSPRDRTACLILPSAATLQDMTKLPNTGGPGGYQEMIWKSDSDARVAIRKAFRDSNGSLGIAARTLGISLRTLSRYVTKLGLRDELKATRRGLRAQDEGPGSYAVLGSGLIRARSTR